MKLNSFKNKVKINWMFNIPSLPFFKKKTLPSIGNFLAKKPDVIENTNKRIVAKLKKGSALRLKTSVFFEGMSVKIITAHVKKGQIVVKNAITLAHEEFPDFLKRDKGKEYYVTFSPASFYSDTITIPQVKSTNYIKPLLKNRLKDVKGASTAFDIVFKDISKSGKDNKTSELFTIAVDTQEILDTMSIFSKAKKDVKLLQTPFSSILPFLSNIGKTAVGIVRTGNSAYIVFIKDSNPVFIKKFELTNVPFSDMDAMQINMSISYIAQTYQEMPSGIYLFSHSGNNAVSVGSTSMPIILFDTTVNIQNLPPDIAMEYILPLGALLSNHEFNLLPDAYSTGRIVKTFTKNAGGAIAAASILLGIYTAISFQGVLSLKAKISSIRSHITPEITTAINYTSSLTNTPVRERIDLKSVEEFLINLSNLVPAEIKLENFKIAAAGGNWEIKLEGEADVGKNAYTVIGMFVAELKTIKGINITESSMSGDDKVIKFTIKANHV